MIIPMIDKLSEKILSLVSKAEEPLETKDIETALGTGSRSRIMYRLNDLRGQGKIKGKRVGSGKGTWIWWQTKNSK